ncbi:MAG TPA: iron-sulfur cluster assembly protein, partial [bacterium]|nr:iron-sulfur cluster assembly protein [bacterium]
MSERSQLLEALRDIKDPELGISIVELGLVKKVELDGKKVQVHVDLTIAACPLKDQIKHSVEEAVAKA